MGKFFNLDSPLMRFLSKVADLLWLNLLTILLCIPIVTAGAAFTALHYTCLKLVRGEESYITKDYFKSFKENLKQGIIIWLIVIAAVALIIVDFYAVNPRIVVLAVSIFGGMDVDEAIALATPIQAAVPENMVTVFNCGLIAATVFVICTITLIFPVLSHFTNTIKGTIKNSLLMSIMIFPKTVLMVILGLVPLAGCYFLPQVLPLFILFWFSAPAYLSAMLYNKTFKRFEPEKPEITDDFSWTLGGDGDPAEEGSDVNSESESENANGSETGN